jgi:uncharacterized protein (TIGR02117 family)
MIFLKPIKIISKLLLLFLSIIILYISIAFLFSLFPTQTITFNSTEKRSQIYILYNNVHSDILFNLKDVSEEWIKNLPIVKNRKKGYIAFGWGDKETYMNTPTWDDIKISTAFKALFINTPSLVHITYYPNINYFQDIKSININKEQDKKIKQSIFKTFNFKENFYKGYGYHDLFYNSNYKYNFIYTCNAWTGDILRRANIRVSYWTPFSYNIINSLP